MSEAEEPRCPSCGVAWVEHLGMIGTCRELQQARADILVLAAEIDRLRNVQASQNAAWAGEVERLNAHLSPPFGDHFRGSTGAAIPRQTKDNQ